MTPLHWKRGDRCVVGGFRGRVWETSVRGVVGIMAIEREDGGGFVYAPREDVELVPLPEPDEPADASLDGGG